MVSEPDTLSYTRDALWGGALVFWQPARGCGYRFNLDPVLLAGFVRPRSTILDLGTGCGILAVLLRAENKADHVFGVEIQDQLASLAERNAQENGFQESIETLHGDLRSLDVPQVDAVVFNPPYFRVGEGRSAPESGRESARRERHGTLEDFVRCARSAVLLGGAIYCIVRIDRLDELAQHFQNHGAAIVRSREVTSRTDADARHVLVEAQPGAFCAWHREAPLVVHEGDGYSAEVRAWLREQCSS